MNLQECVRLVRAAGDPFDCALATYSLPAKALSVKQPWAFLLAAGIKDLENRVWAPTNPPFNEALLIHASAKPDLSPEASALARAIAGRFGGSVIEYGAIIGSAFFTSYVRGSSDSPWYAGPVGWEFDTRKAQLFPASIPVKGRLGIWQFPSGGADQW